MGASSAMVLRESGDLQQWTPRFVMSVDDAVDLVKQKREFFERAMVEDVHYGRIPGMPAESKPALLKAGAEFLAASMSLHPVLGDAEPPVRDFTGHDHNGEPFWSFHKTCRIYRQTGPGELDRMLVAEADGSCNSFEVKYRYRQRKLSCPTCGAEAILRSKPPKDDPDRDPETLGFFCWKKQGGCGENFHHDDERIRSQKLGRIPNPDIFDLENTGLKMSGKRALVAATLIATGCSDIFTQDLEDRLPDDESEGGSAPASTKKAAAAAAKGGVTKEQRDQLEALANSLPKPTVDPMFSAMLRAGYEVALTALLKQHADQCGAAACRHVKELAPAVVAGPEDPVD